jgi:hypothetical protein
VLGVADHVDDGDAGGVELLNGVLGGHADGAHEKSSFLLDDDVDELVKVATGVVVVGLAGTATDLWSSVSKGGRGLGATDKCARKSAAS